MKGSNIIIKSNIYPRKGLLSNDKEFIKQVNSRLALKKLKGYTSFNESRDITAIQREIYNNELIKCIHNEEGDITSGIVSIEGVLKWEIRCEEIDCRRFSGCRPNISEIEIEEIIERKERHWNKLENKKTLEEDTYIQNKTDIGMEEFLNRYIKKQTEESSKIELDIKEHFESTIVPKEKEILEETIKVEKEIAAVMEMEIMENSQSQSTVINMNSEKRILVDAPPGTGKTYTLIERIKYLVLKEKISPNELMILSFSRSAISEINDRIKENISENHKHWDLNKVDIRTFDSFASYIIRAMVDDPASYLIGKGYDERIEIAANIIDEYNELFVDIKHVIIDEVQDLVGVRAKMVQSILKNINCGFTLLGDRCQSIYDYQVEDEINDITSLKFNNWLIEKYEDSLIEFKFDKNYRQTKELSETTLRLREAILNGDGERQLKVAKNTIDEINIIGQTINFPSNKLKENERVALLCRTNGEVLKVSKELRHQDIDHIVQKPSTYRLLEPWIAEVFNYDEALRIDYDEFKNRMKEIRPEYKNMESYWNILKEIEGERGSYIDIENLSKELVYRQLQYNQLLIERDSNLVISTIHRAKGKEYDQVILLDESILERYEEDQIPQEVKVCYVALTRSKTKIKRIQQNSKFYGSKNRGNSGRWVSTYLYYGKPKVADIEVGKENDIDSSSFVSKNLFDTDSKVIENQEYIKGNIKKNDEIQLRLTIDKEMKQEYFDIYHYNRRIGRMSDSFTDSIFRVYKIRNRNLTYMPNEINGIYIDEICSYVGSDNVYNIGTDYERKRIWLGVSIVGFGTRRNYNKY